MARLQHVTIPIPEGGQDEGRALYAGVLGFEYERALAAGVGVEKEMIST